MATNYFPSGLLIYILTIWFFISASYIKQQGKILYIKYNI